jgi:hypothetical protein
MKFSQQNDDSGHQLCVSWSSSTWKPKVVVERNSSRHFSIPKLTDGGLVVTKRHAQVGDSDRALICIAKARHYSASPVFNTGKVRYSN